MRRAQGAARGVVRLIALGMALGGSLALAAPGDTTRVSVDSLGAQAAGNSSRPSISADGRYVAFQSLAADLVPGDTNGHFDVFVHDRQTRGTTRVSIGPSGAQSNESSFDASISGDGRYVAFWSHATNLVANDTNGHGDVFVHDRQTGITTRVSVDSAGGQGNDGQSILPSISADGRYVAFVTYASNLLGVDYNAPYSVVVHDRQTGITTRVSVDSAGGLGNGTSDYPSISADGRHVAFLSDATDLVIDDSNGSRDVFVHDRQTGITTRVSVDSAGGQANGDSYPPSISADGRHVAFGSSANNLVVGDSNGNTDVFVHDRQTGITTRVSVDSAGQQGNFVSGLMASISADGRHVAFQSFSANLVAGDSNSSYGDVFAHDRQTGMTTLVSVNSAGKQSAGFRDIFQTYPSVSEDGRYVAFDSPASDLVTDDTNGTVDVFMHERAVAADVPSFNVAEIPPPTDETGCESGYAANVIAWGLNDTAEVVGARTCYVETGQPESPYVQRSRGFRWNASTSTGSLPTPPSLSPESFPRDINESGVALGYDWSNQGYVIWQPGGQVSEYSDAENCRTPPFVLAGGINGAGTVAFTTYRRDSTGACRRAAALRRADGSLITDTNYFRSFAVNNQEQAVGSVQSTDIGAARWSPTGGLVVLEAPEAGRNKYAQGVNEEGDAVGFVGTYSAGAGCLYSTSDAMLWRADGSKVVLPVTGGLTMAYAVGINDSGAVVGYSEDPATCEDPSKQAAMLWKDGHAWNLNDLVSADPNVRLLDAVRVNSSGQILARGIRTDEPKRSCPALVYDPATGGQKWDDTIMCQPTHSYLLTPVVASTYSITPQSVTKKESDGTVSFTVTRTPATAAEKVYVSTVQTYGFLNDGDYVGLEDVALAFAAGDAEETVTIQLRDDQKAGEQDETFGLIVQKTPGPVTEFVASATFTIQDSNVSAVPSTPTNPTPGAVASPGPVLPGTSVALSWDASTGATYYSIAVRDMVTNVLVVDTTTASTSYPASLTAGGQYRWNVAACNASDCSLFTAPLYFQMQTVGPPPGEPVLSVAPAGPINFGGPVEIKTEITETLIVTNAGGGRLTGTCVASEPYSVAGCAFDLPERQSASFTLTFRPTDPVPYPSNVRFFSNAKNEVTIVLEGEGKSAEPPPNKKPYVVFLPGFLGSRLWTYYSRNGSEEKNWIPVDNPVNPFDFPRLSFCSLRPMETGMVLGQYTKPMNQSDEGNSGLLSEALGVSNIYLDFVEFMDDLTNTGSQVIDGWEAIPYDWRISVDDLADTSEHNWDRGFKRCGDNESNCTDRYSVVAHIIDLHKNGQTPVTLIGHSNGGLFAKAVVKELESLPEVGPDRVAEYVDRIILVASPQLGTPKAYVGMLHGDQLPGTLSQLVELPDAAVREFAETTPGAYGLLPSTEYLEQNASDTLILFAKDAKNPILKDFVNAYGQSISGKDVGDLRSFLTAKVDKRSEPATGVDACRLAEGESVPNVLRPTLLDQAAQMHSQLDRWQAPPALEVVQIVGTGRDTPTGVYYKDADCNSEGCADIDWEPLASFGASEQGDGTVVPESAAAMAAKTYRVDLSRWCQPIANHSHLDMLESDTVQAIIQAVLEGTEYPSETCVDASGATSRMALQEAMQPYVPVRRIQLQSPAELHVYDDEGRHTGLMTGDDSNGRSRRLVQEQIPNSSWNRLNGHETISVEGYFEYEARVEGLRAGLITLVSQEFFGEGASIEVIFRNVPVNSVSQGKLQLFSAGGSSGLEMDFNGDSAVDAVVRPTNGNDATPSLESLAAYIQALALPGGMKASLNSKINEAISSLASGDTASAKGALGAIAKFLKAQSGKQIPTSIAQDLELFVVGISASI